MGNKHPRYDDDFYDWITTNRNVDVNMAYAMCELMQDAWRARAAKDAQQPIGTEQVQNRYSIEPVATSQQPVGKMLIADEKENVWRDDSGDIWEPIRARERESVEVPFRRADHVEAMSEIIRLCKRTMKLEKTVGKPWTALDKINRVAARQLLLMKTPMQDE